jgi:hypothetical protein
MDRDRLRLVSTVSLGPGTVPGTLKAFNKNHLVGEQSPLGFEPQF